MAREKEASSEPPMLRGSLITLRRKCGRASCRYAEGHLHETPALSYSVEGRTKMLTLPEADLEEVRAGIARYQKAVGELERAGRAGIEALRRRIEAGKTGGRGRRALPLASGWTCSGRRLRLHQAVVRYLRGAYLGLGALPHAAHCHFPGTRRRPGCSACS